MRRPLQRRLLMGSALLLLLFVFFCVHQLLEKSTIFGQYNTVRNFNIGDVGGAGSAVPATRSILLWSSFFDDARWKLPADTLSAIDFRDELHCPIWQCELSNQHDYLPHIELYDAIVFHGAEPFPLINSVPATRSPQQSYVFALLEPPGETKHLLIDEQNFYNLTMSYRLDSDIVWPYMHLIDIETSAVVAPSMQPHWRPAPATWNDTDIWLLHARKTKMAAWFVSHCPTLSQREQLVAALQQHIQVDIYGKCGNLSCQRFSQKCDDMLDTDYYFYLSFENSLCTDYVTEKLYTALQRHIVPVVFGGANYTRFLPPHSYIDADGFDSAQALAQHLQHVASDVQAYMRYFWWRRHYKLGDISPFCELCARMHTASWRHKRQVYEDIASWWLTSCRFNSNIKF